MLFAELLIPGILEVSCISYSTTFAIFSPTFRSLFLMQVLYVTHSIRIGRANDPGFRSLDSSLKDRLTGLKNPKSRLRYLEAMLEQLIRVTRAVNIKHALGAQ